MPKKDKKWKQKFFKQSESDTCFYLHFQGFFKNIVFTFVALITKVMG